MHNGFYNELEELLKEDDDATFDFMDSEELGVDELRGSYKFTANYFLHGFCNVFAQVLNEIYGYPIECIYNEEGRLVHCFCVDETDDGPIFIDARGKTTDYYELICEFEDEIDYYGYYPVENTQRYFELPHDLYTNGDCYIEFAKKLIANHSSYYRRESI